MNDNKATKAHRQPSREDTGGVCLLRPPTYISGGGGALQLCKDQNPPAVCTACTATSPRSAKKPQKQKQIDLDE